MNKQYRVTQVFSSEDDYSWYRIEYRLWPWLPFYLGYVGIEFTMENVYKRIERHKQTRNVVKIPDRVVYFG